VFLLGKIITGGMRMRVVFLVSSGRDLVVSPRAGEKYSTILGFLGFPLFTSPSVLSDRFY
jgi:hypothetical protein